jgi:hypothetical protein
MLLFCHGGSALSQQTLDPQQRFSTEWDHRTAFFFRAFIFTLGSLRVCTVKFSGTV